METIKRKTLMTRRRAFSTILRRIDLLSQRIESNPHFDFDKQERSALRWTIERIETLTRENNAFKRELGLPVDEHEEEANGNIENGNF
jgi:hypothetical protein